MKRKKVVIHIGMPKTATTFLQENYFDKISEITYIGRPYTQENKAFNTLQYADDSIFSYSEFVDEVEKIKNHDEQSHTVLISDELLFGHALYNFINRGIIAERLSRAIPDAEIIIFIRNQLDFVLSFYKQLVKNGWFNEKLNERFIYPPGNGLNLNTWFEGRRSWNPKDRYINHRSLFNTDHIKYTTMLDLYKRHFKKVHVFLYEDFKKDSNAYLDKVDSILELKSSTKELRKTNSGKTTNTSIDRDRLKSRLTRNKLKPILQKDNSVNKFFTRALSTILKLDHANLHEDNLNYLLELLKIEKIYEDNLIAHQKWSLGMDKYAELYFDENRIR